MTVRSIIGDVEKRQSPVSTNSFGNEKKYCSGSINGEPEWMEEVWMCEPEVKRLAMNRSVGR